MSSTAKLCKITKARRAAYKEMWHMRILCAAATLLWVSIFTTEGFMGLIALITIIVILIMESDIRRTF